VFLLINVALLYIFLGENQKLLML